MYSCKATPTNSEVSSLLSSPGICALLNPCAGRHWCRGYTYTSVYRRPPPILVDNVPDTGVGDRGGSSAEFAVVAETVSGREDVDSVDLSQGAIEFEDDKMSVVPNFAPFHQKLLGN
jgi:hypothetical protein